MKIIKGIVKYYKVWNAPEIFLQRKTKTLSHAVLRHKCYWKVSGASSKGHETLMICNIGMRDLVHDHLNNFVIKLQIKFLSGSHVLAIFPISPIPK